MGDLPRGFTVLILGVRNTRTARAGEEDTEEEENTPLHKIADNNYLRSLGGNCTGPNDSRKRRVQYTCQTQAHRRTR